MMSLAHGYPSTFGGKTEFIRPGSGCSSFPMACPAKRPAKSQKYCGKTPIAEA